MRALQRRALSLLALAATLACGGAWASSVLFGCSSDDPPSNAPKDGGSEGSLLGDAMLPDPDADIPLGEVCGDAQGLEKDSPWPLRGGCPKRGGLSLNGGPQTSNVKWSLPLPGAESSPVIAADRLVWIGTTDGDVVAVSPAGVVHDALHTGGAVRSSPARSATGLTVIGSADGMLYGVDRGRISPVDAGADADAGELDAGDEAGSPVTPAKAVWKRALGPIASSPVIGADGTIYVSATDGKLYAVAADGSATKWSATTGDTLGSSPALAQDGTIYVGSSDHKLYALDAAGKAKWTFETGGAISGSPIVGGDETIYVGSADGKLYAVAPDGKSRWAYATGGPITGAPAIRAGVVYVGSDDKKLHAVNTPSGTRKWAYDTLGAVATPLVAADGTIYVGSSDGNLYAVAPSGLLFFAVKAKGRIRSAPALSDDQTLYVTTDTSLLAIGQ